MGDVTEVGKLMMARMGTEQGEQNVTRGYDDHWIYSTLQINWILRGFSDKFINEAEYGSRIRSDPCKIMVGKIETIWQTYLYPNGNGDDYNCLGIYLNKVKETSQNYEVCARFSIMRNEKELVHKQFRSFQNSASIKLGSGCGYGNFILHENILRKPSRYIKNSYLNFRVQIILRAPKSEGEIFLHQSVEVED